MSHNKIRIGCSRLLGQTQPALLLACGILCANALAADSKPQMTLSEARVVNRAPHYLAPNLHLKDYIQTVLDHNEFIQAQMLGAEADRRRFAAELGIFEPSLQGNVNRVGTHRQNNSEQQTSQNIQEFKERNNIYDTGVESLIPTGGKIRLGYSLSDLGNNLTPVSSPFGTTTTGIFTNQWQSFMGATFTQPLLKNGGVDVTLSKIRLAALQTDIGFQEYRRQLMIAVTKAEGAYWNLYFAQQQLEFVDEALQLAQSVLDDSKAKLKAGKGTELDVLEGESGVALEQTKRNIALQHYYDAITDLCTLCGSTPPQGDIRIKAVDEPECQEMNFSYFTSCQDLFNLNPDYLIQKQHVAQETIRLGVARNQMLPEVNAKAAYGYSGLSDSPTVSGSNEIYGSSPRGAWKALRSQNYPAWSIGVEVNIPLFGGIEGRNALAAAKASQKEAQTTLLALGTQITNALSNSIQKNRTFLGSVRDFETVVKFREELVKNTMAKLQAGKTEAWRVLQESKDLFEARQSLAEAEVQYQRSLLDVEWAEGTVLKKRNLEITRQQLREKTIAMLKGRQFAVDAPVTAVSAAVPAGKKAPQSAAK